MLSLFFKLWKVHKVYSCCHHSWWIHKLTQNTFSYPSLSEFSSYLPRKKSQVAIYVLQQQSKTKQIRILQKLNLKKCSTRRQSILSYFPADNTQKKLHKTTKTSLYKSLDSQSQNRATSHIFSKQKRKKNYSECF